MNPQHSNVHVAEVVYDFDVMDPLEINAALLAHSMLAKKQWRALAVSNADGQDLFDRTTKLETGITFVLENVDLAKGEHCAVAQTLSTLATTADSLNTNYVVVLKRMVNVKWFWTLEKAAQVYERVVIVRPVDSGVQQ